MSWPCHASQLWPCVLRCHHYDFILFPSDVILLILTPSFRVTLMHVTYLFQAHSDVFCYWIMMGLFCLIL